MTRSISLKEILKANKDQPVEKSAPIVAAGLATAYVLVAIKGSSPEDIEFMMATDKNNKLWLYCFTDEDEFSNAFPKGGQFADMAFADLFQTIEPEERFGGVILNSKSEAKYLIPREMFGYLKKLIAKSA
jgi:hypothetical protein